MDTDTYSKFKLVCTQSRTYDALLDLACEAQGYEAYTQLCGNLGIAPQMDDYTYMHARTDLAERHVKSLFLDWAKQLGVRDVGITLYSNGKDSMVIDIGSYDGRLLGFLAPGTSTALDPRARVTRVLLKFSILWAAV